MSAKEAYEKIMSRHPGLKVIKAYEYDSLFVFTVVSETSAIKDPNRLIDRMRSVDKKTGMIRDFKPFYISVEEYRNGREITNYK